MANGPVCTHDWGRYIALAPPGPIAEFGCYDGGATRIMAGFGRDVYAFDTFEGIPKEDFCRSLDSENPPGKFTPTEAIEALFKGYPNIIPVKGRFKYTLPQWPDLKIAFAYLDCDLYLSYKQVLAWLPTHLTGKYFIVDDYLACEGAARAIDEWRGDHPEWEFDGRSLFTKT